MESGRQEVLQREPVGPVVSIKLWSVRIPRNVIRRFINLILRLGEKGTFMTTNMWISIVGIAYFMIGIFFAALIDGEDFSGGSWVWILFWPVALVLLVTFVIVSIPFALGIWIRDRLNLD